MSVTVDSVNTLYRYFQGVIDRAEHHGPAVNEVVYPIIGLVIAHMDEESTLKVYGTEGSAGNVLWVVIRGTRYAITYSHADQCIQLRKGSMRGPVSREFTNATPISALKAVFKKL